jgi:hypothetical protein
MATRSNIGIRERDGSIRVNYCHWDGYLAHVGRILLAHYDSDTRVRELLALGELSSLAPTLDETHAYHRDRGEEWKSAGEFAPGEFRLLEEYAYVYDVSDQRWLWAAHGMELTPLTPEDVANG